MIRNSHKLGVEESIIDSIQSLQLDLQHTSKLSVTFQKNNYSITIITANFFDGAQLLATAVKQYIKAKNI